MRNDKILAIQLRKQGKSYNAISKELKVAKSTLSNWLKNVPWSSKIKRRLLKISQKNAKERMVVISRRAKQKRTALYNERRLFAQKIFKKYRRERLFIAGLMIYWGEGDSNLNNGMIRVTNTDPLMLKLFHIFLKKYLPEICSKLKAYLILYPDLSDNKCKKFWSQQIGVSQEKFIKSQYIRGNHPTKRLLYGICTVLICNRANKEVILEWINLTKSEINTMRV